jgi:predicted MFS family arabinose efflux permease
MRRSPWAVVLAYTAVAAALQLLWLSYAAITTDSAHRYGVSVGAIGWLSEIFPLLFVVLALPAGLLIDRSLRGSLALGALLVAGGGLVRLLQETYACALAGQVLVAIAQPIVVSAVVKLAAEYVEAERRPLAIAIGSGGNFAGMLAAVVLGPLLADHGHLERLLVVEAVLGVLPGAWLLLVLRHPGGQAGAANVGGGRAEIARLWRIAPLRDLCGLMLLGFGIFVALATWLQTLLHPDHVSDTTAGVLLLVMLVAGVAGCAALPTRVAERGAERAYMGSVVGLTGATCLLLAIDALPLRFAALVVMGFVLLPALPVVLTAAEWLAGPAAGTAGAMVWTAGNLGGLACAVLTGALVHHQLLAFSALALVAFVGTPLAARLAVRSAPGGAQRTVAQHAPGGLDAGERDAPPAPHLDHDAAGPLVQDDGRVGVERVDARNGA